MALTIDATNNVGQLPKTLQPPAGGALIVYAGLLDLDNSYATGGYPLTPSLFGMSKVNACVPASTSGGKPTAIVSGKLKVFSAIGTEVSNATDLSAETVEVVVVGI